ncbi:hypothetical protein FACS189459_1420 [Bacilli bacterium]|nr:hypothetical protein FACS189459_1420 [Bacilli bacterium]
METKVSIKGLFNEKENELLACLKRADSVNHPTHKGDISENA